MCKQTKKAKGGYVKAKAHWDAITYDEVPTGIITSQ